MRPRGVIQLAVLLAMLSGCTTLRATVDGWSDGTDGLSRPQRQLREALAGGDFPTALAWREDDALLNALTTGATTFYAAQYARSAAALDTAALLADERVTASLSKNALSLFTNDMALPYRPRRTERLFMPYYGMLAYAQLGQWEDASVEARRVVALLAQFKDERDEGERTLHALMHYVAGVVFERAGERNESAVAYRNARALVSAFVDPQALRTPSEGEVVVVMERGFVAHRATETMRVALSREESVRIRADDDLVYLTLAFPSLRRSPRPWADLPRLSLDSTGVGRVADVSVSVNVDDASAVDERRERAELIARELARTTTKYIVTKAVHDRSGDAAGRLAGIGAALLERADVRSWHLLPQEVVIMRVPLSAGQHPLHVEVGDGANRRELDLGTVTVRPGRVTLLSARFWRERAPESLARCEGRTPSCRREGGHGADSVH